MGIRSAFPRLIVAAAFALSPSVASWAADCPVDESGYTRDDWPTSVSVSGIWDLSHLSSGLTICGESINSQGNHSSGGYTSYGAAYAALIALGYSGWSVKNTCYAQNASTWAGYYVVLEYAPNNWRRGFRIKSSIVAGECTPVEPPPPEPKCGDGTDGKGFSIRTLPGSIDTEGRCMDGCEVAELNVNYPGMDKDPDGTYWFTGWARFSGEECAAEGDPMVPDDQMPAPEDEPVPEPDDEVCSTTAAGNTVCVDKDYGENCGYINGQYTCLEKTDPDKCWVNDDGSRWCAEKAPTPPKPDNGTPGVKAPPEDKVVICKEGVCKEYDYHSTDQVENSSRPPGNDGSNPADPTSTDPKTGGGGGGGGGGIDWTKDDKVGGGEKCDAPPTCSGDPIACAQLLQQWRARCPASMTPEQMRSGITSEGIGADGKFPAGSTVALGEGDFDSAGFLGGRTCPIPTSFDLGEFGSVGFDASSACALLNALAAMILVGGWLSAARIAFGA